jgi:hypothetical protein
VSVGEAGDALADGEALTLGVFVLRVLVLLATSPPQAASASAEAAMPSRDFVRRMAEVLLNWTGRRFKSL